MVVVVVDVVVLVVDVLVVVVVLVVGPWLFLIDGTQNLGRCERLTSGKRANPLPLGIAGDGARDDVGVRSASAPVRRAPVSSPLSRAMGSG